MPVEKITKWRTTDGAEFYEESEARRHDEIEQLAPALEAHLDSLDLDNARGRTRRRNAIIEWERWQASKRAGSVEADDTLGERTP